MKHFGKATLIAICCLFLFACANEEDGTKEDGPNKDELILAIGGEPDDGFDPVTGWGRLGAPLFQSTLYTYDVDFNIVPDLAAADYEVSEDGLTWEVELQKDIKFSDGEPLTADDVVFTYEEARQSGSVVDLQNLASVKKEDETTVAFKLKEPQSTFIHVLAATGIVPEHVYDEHYNQAPIGSGPYQLVQWDKGQQLIVEANPHYYGEASHFKKLTFLFLSEDASFAAARAGEVDVALTTPAFANEEVKDMELIALDTVDNRGVTLPYVKSGQETEDGYKIGNDVTADIPIRKAMNLAVDREALVDGVLEGYGSPAYTIVDGLPWWNEETVFEDNKIDQAKTLLTEAGWQENENGIREKNGLKATLTLVYPAEDQVRQALSMYFADMMAPLGIEIKTEGKSWNEIEKVMHHDLVMMGKGSHDPLAMYMEYSSDTMGEGFHNANYYSNPAVDDHMNQALRATDEQEALTYWKKAQWDGETGLSEKGDAPWVWLVNLEHLYFVDEDLEIGEQKIQPHGHGWPITDFIAEWHWKTD